MKHLLARYTSLILHPIVFAFVLPFIVVYHNTQNVEYGLQWMIFTVFFVFIGFLAFFILRPKDVFTDFDLSHKNKRPIFYATALLFAVLYFIVAVLFKGIFFPLTIVSIGVILGIVLFELVNFYLKASIHVGMVSALVVTVGLLYGFTAGLAILWTPFALGWSRLVLKKHTKPEIIIGGVLGSMVTIITFAVARILVYNKY